MEHKKIVVKWKEFRIPEVKKRMYDVNLSIDFIITISGPRRAGKTYFCFQLINKLIDEGISRENIFYVNFEDNMLLGANADDLDEILDCYVEVSNINPTQKLYLFFDEIQTVNNWDSWARKISDQRKDIKLILTGSSSKLLSREISTKLRGRVINKEIFPLSFKETILWQNISYNIKTLEFSRDKIIIKKDFLKYLVNGGYPALFILNNLEHEQILQSYYDSMIFKDVIERYKIEEVNKLKTVAQLLFQSVSSEISYSKLTNKLKTAGFNMSKNTIIEYLSYFEDSYLFFINFKYEYSLAKQIGSIKKIYCIDNGLLNAVSFKFKEDVGKLLENLVYIELRRRGNTIYRHKANNDCDFIISDKNKVISAMQVTRKFDEENEHRELLGLVEAMKEHNLNTGLILTEDQTQEKVIENKKILIKPVWQWLLEEV